MRHGGYPTDLPAVTAAGFAALNRGDPNAARALFEQAVSAGVADGSVWYAIDRFDGQRRKWTD